MRIEHNRLTGPFRLRDLKNGMLQIHSPSGAFEGTRERIMVKAVNLGVDKDDLLFALEELADTGDDYAEFGIFGKFLFTKRDRKAA